MNQAYGRQHRGFSLLELSIAIVVIGLLIGAVLAGKQLIRNSEVNSLISDYNKYTSAINNFHMQYNAIPGDMTNATEFWGRADNGSFSGQCNDPFSDSGTGTQTCNGDGDGQVFSWGSYEQFRFWEHLANAGLIKGQFTGVTGPNSSSHHVPGVNSPGTEFQNVGWGFDEGSYPGNYNYWNVADLNVDPIGGDLGDVTNNLATGDATSFHYEDPFLTPSEMYSIDSKIDDGKPGTGLMWSHPVRNCTDVWDGTDYAIAQYNMDRANEILCSITFPNVF